MKNQKTATFIFAGLLSLQFVQAQPVLDTAPLTLEGDIASQLVAGVDRFLLRELANSVARREQHWQRDFASHEAYANSVEPNRRHLAHIIGLRDRRIQFEGLTLTSTTAGSALAGQTERITLRAVSWPAFGDVTATGLLLEPRGRDAEANIVALPDCNQFPEQIAGLAEGLPPKLSSPAVWPRAAAALSCRCSSIAPRKCRSSPTGSTFTGPHLKWDDT